MKTPRFDIRAAKLRLIFSPANIEQIWTKKVRISMRDQYINDGIENFDFHINRSLESKKLSQLILSGDYVPSKAQRILVEKSKGLCRQIVIPSVRDSIVLQCLSDALYADIRGKAPTNKSFYEPKDHSFSNGISGYGTFASWLNFQKALLKFSKTRRYVVVTDIANYYDTISYPHLRNAISSIANVQECVLDMLIYVLSDLLWQPDYTPRIEVGLPQINLDAPRLLAHCFLYELDEFLDSDPNRDFVRFMDDIDIGVDTIVEAKQILKSIDLVLQTKQVRLNSGKTNILTRREAIQHFRAADNARIDTLKERIKRKMAAGLPIDQERRIVELRILRGVKGKKFDSGNGDKILKRLIGLASTTQARVSLGVLENLVRNRPSIRETVFSHIASRPLTPARAKILVDSAKSGLLVDDAGLVAMANHLVETLVKSTTGIQQQIDELIAVCGTEKYFDLYSRLWLQSKYDTTENIYETLRNSQQTWIASERLGRVVASLTPLFYDTCLEDDFASLLFKSMNPGVREAYKFHKNLSNDISTFNLMFTALKSPNPSKGTAITHPKYLCLLSAMRNKNAIPGKLDTLRNNNAMAFKDIYYRRIAKRLNVY